jgi:hypothetical protein
VLPAAILACAIAWWSMASVRFPYAQRRWAGPVAPSVLAAAAVAAVFFSSFFSAPAAMFEPFRGARTYLARGINPVSHAHPWHYYLRLLSYTSSGGLRWTEGVIVALAVVGGALAWRRPDAGHPERIFWARFLACDVAISATIFSLIPYKTPWNVLSFYVVTVVVAGVGFAALVDVMRARAARGALVAALALACVHLGWQAWRAAVVYAADPRNPYVYAQTVPDAVRMAARIRDLSTLHPDGARMQVSVIASPYEQWPLPWYLRAMPNVGYWTAPGDPLALQAPVIVSAIEHTPALDAALGDRYVSEFFGLRPEVPLALYTERGLWDRFLQSAK